MHSRLNIKPRRAVNIDQPQLAANHELFGAGHFGTRIEALVPGVRLLDWCKPNVAELEQRLLQRGAILFRGFALDSLACFQQVSGLFGPKSLAYRYRSTPRTQVGDGVYTATEYPASQSIPLHNEMSYARTWPSRVAFYCSQPALSGGETPLCDSRRVWANLDLAVRQKFEQLGVMYVRHYQRHSQQGLGLSWQETFQVGTCKEVEAICDELHLEWTWQGERLCTRQVCQASVAHPATGEKVWFNQAHLFHVSSLAQELRDTLLAAQGEENLSRNAYYGDGTAIEEQVLEHIRSVFQGLTLAFDWHRGDVLLLDNLLTAHGRNPFHGDRKLFVSMV